MLCASAFRVLQAGQWFVEGFPSQGSLQGVLRDSCKGSFSGVFKGSFQPEQVARRVSSKFRRFRLLGVSELLVQVLCRQGIRV